MEKYFFSKNYKETKSAGNKAKTDIEEILLTNGYKNSEILLYSIAYLAPLFLLPLGYFKLKEKQL